MALLVLPEQLAVLVFKVVSRVLLVLLELEVVALQLLQVQKYFLGIVVIQYKTQTVVQRML